MGETQEAKADALYLGTPLTTLDNNSGISDFCHRDVDALVRYNVSALCLYDIAIAG